VGQADHNREAINGVHLDLINYISQISQLVADHVNEARGAYTYARRKAITSRAPRHSCTPLSRRSAERGVDLLERRNPPAAPPPRSIAARATATATLNFKTITEIVRRIHSMIAANLQAHDVVDADRFIEGFLIIPPSSLDMMENRGRTEQLTNLVVETANNLADPRHRVEELTPPQNPWRSLVL